MPSIYDHGSYLTVSIWKIYTQMQQIDTVVGHIFEEPGARCCERTCPFFKISTGSKVFWHFWRMLILSVVINLIELNTCRF